MYGIMTKELVLREIRIDEAAGRGDSDSRMMSFEVIMPLNSVGSFVISCFFFGKSKNSLDFERRHHKL